MKRILIGALCACVIVVVAEIAGRTTQSYQVAAVFDNADGIVTGSQVKIAGAVVGSVQTVQLRSGPTARIVMTIEPRFRPFRRDADCTILPEGLISENYVECDPGSARQPPLPVAGGGAATLPLSNTTVPLSLQQVINVFSLPTDERLQVMLSELGIATAGRGQDLNGLLLRSNPALTQARRLLGIVAMQRNELADGIAQTNHVLASLAINKQSVRQFVDRAATVSVTSAAHSSALAASFARFPPLLRALDPALDSLHRAAAAGTPVLAGLHAAAPELTRLTYTLPPFLTAATRSLPTLTAAARTGLSTVHDSSSLVSDLHTAAANTIPFAKDANRTFISIRNNGGFEAFLRAFYSLASTTAGYDQLSHFQAGYLSFFPQCMNKQPAAGCDARYNAPGGGTIPANDPGCGPQSDATWAPATSCVAQAQNSPDRSASQRRLRRAAPPRPAQPGATGSQPSGSPLTPSGSTGGRPGGIAGPVTSILDSLTGATHPSPPAVGPLSALLNYLLAK